MDEVCWLNGEFLPVASAKISVEDRGMLFADGVYEVCRIYDGTIFALEEHLDRLDQSCAGIDLAQNVSRDALRAAAHELVARSQIRSGTIYLQVTRGGGRRQHLFPKDAQPTVFMIPRPLPAPTAPETTRGMKLVSLPDDRWQRCWIKSIALLPNILAKNTADRGGADEGVFVLQSGGEAFPPLPLRDGVGGGSSPNLPRTSLVTEGSTTTVFLVRNGVLITAPIGPKVLPGITRLFVLKLAAQLKIRIDERYPTLDEALGADEAFIASTTKEVAWVERWDDRIYAAHPGPVTLQLANALRDHITAQTNRS
jgi:D-alanine transaminase